MERLGYPLPGWQLGHQHPLVSTLRRGAFQRVWRADELHRLPCWHPQRRGQCQLHSVDHELTAAGDDRGAARIDGKRDNLDLGDTYNSGGGDDDHDDDHDGHGSHVVATCVNRERDNVYRVFCHVYHDDG